ncbi:unnamed protein product, partial [Mesorhabditis belari]|uniref:Uncharacterized protein n=1 Tax=Mesorhabditis belari TaxID=2138241 RepID=A0AAF3EMD9_9BILA
MLTDFIQKQGGLEISGLAEYRSTGEKTECQPSPSPTGVDAEDRRNRTSYNDLNTEQQERALLQVRYKCQQVATKLKKLKPILDCSLDEDNRPMIR